MKWTEERLDSLRELALTKMSASKIAKRMGTNKNSIIGACHRYDIKLLNRRKQSDEIKDIIKEIDESREESSKGKFTWLSIRDGYCRWPIGETPNSVPCGVKTLDTRDAYCPNHRAISLRKDCKNAKTGSGYNFRRTSI